MNKLIYILFIFCTQICYAQTQIITAKVANDKDDVEISNRLYTNSSDLELGGFDSDNNGKQFTLIRFQNLALPVNSTVTKAYIQFFTKSANAQRANLSIRCQLGNASSFSNLANALSRVYTPNSVAWNPLAWTVTGESDSIKEPRTLQVS